MSSVEEAKRLVKPRLRGTVQVAVLEAVAAAFEGDDLGVVNEPVDHGGSSDLVAELSPLARTACCSSRSNSLSI